MDTVTVSLTPAQLAALVSAVDRAVGRCGDLYADDDLGDAYTALCDAGGYQTAEETADEVKRLIHGSYAPLVGAP